MRVKYTGKDDPLTLRAGKVYDVMAIGDWFYRVLPEDARADVPETMVGFMASKNIFEIVESEPAPPAEETFLKEWYQSNPELAF